MDERIRISIRSIISQIYEFLFLRMKRCLNTFISLSFSSLSLHQKLIHYSNSRKFKLAENISLPISRNSSSNYTFASSSKLNSLAHLPIHRESQNFTHISCPLSRIIKRTSDLSLPAWPINPPPLFPDVTTSSTRN